MRGARKTSFVTKLGRMVTKTAVFGLKGFVIGYCIFEYGIDVTKCTGPSMEPTILHGDHILIEKITRLRKSFRRGDIVVSRSPSDPSQLLCKRLVGMPGDVLTSPVIGDVTVPRGRVYLQGDNYRNSYDSRTFGPVPIALLEGRAIFKLNKWEPLQGPPDD